jgi:hypothetical protein
VKDKFTIAKEYLLSLNAFQEDTQQNEENKEIHDDILNLL